MRYFADAALALDSIKAGLAAADPGFKIDGGELTRGGELLGEIEINRPGSDMFDDDIAGMLVKLERIGGPAGNVIAHVRNARSLLALQVMDGARPPETTMEMLGPLWSVLQQLANGLWHIGGQGFYDGGQLLVAVE